MRSHRTTNRGRRHDRTRSSPRSTFTLRDGGVPDMTVRHPTAVRPQRTPAVGWGRSTPSELDAIFAIKGSLLQAILQHISPLGVLIAQPRCFAMADGRSQKLLDVSVTHPKQRSVVLLRGNLRCRPFNGGRQNYRNRQMTWSPWPRFHNTVACRTPRHQPDLIIARTFSQILVNFSR